MIKKKFLIIAYHPVSYQLPLFLAIQNSLSKFDTKVLFLDDITLKPKFFKSINGFLDIKPSSYLNDLNHSFAKNYSFIKNILFLSKFNPGIVKEIYSCDALLIHGYDNFSFLLALICSVFFRKRLIFRGEATIREYNKKNMIKKFFRFLKNLYVRTYLSYSSEILYSCEGNKEYFKRWIKDQKKLIYFPCCVDNKKCLSYVSNDLKEKLKNKYNIDKEKLVIGYSGRLTKRKNIINLVKAIQHMNFEISKNFHLFIIGGGPMEKSILKEVESHKNKINFTISGFLPLGNSLQHFNLLDIFCIPSFYDPSPKALNEAMNFSLPVLVSNKCGTCNDLVDEGHNGYIFDPKDIIELSRLLTLFYNKKKMIKEFGFKSKLKVSSFSPNYAANCLRDRIENNF